MTSDPTRGTAMSFFRDWTEENTSKPSLAQRLREKRPSKN